MGLFSNLPVGLAPGLGLNAYVSPTVTQPRNKSPSLILPSLVRILRRWLPWRWVNQLSRSPGRRVSGRVRHQYYVF